MLSGTPIQIITVLFLHGTKQKCPIYSQFSASNWHAALPCSNNNTLHIIAELLTTQRITFGIRKVQIWAVTNSTCIILKWKLHDPTSLCTHLTFELNLYEWLYMAHELLLSMEREKAIYNYKNITLILISSVYFK